MKKNLKNKVSLLIVSMAMGALLTGCVDQSGGKEKSGNDLQIAATSTAIVSICEQLDIPLVGIPESSLMATPDIYKEATVIGSPMAPDMEKLADLNPDWVLSPSTLISDLQPKYDAAGLNYAFVNLKSVRGMYDSIDGLGELFGKEQEAAKLRKEYEEFVASIKEGVSKEEAPSVLILMGLPNGAYIVATENSYAGDMLDLAGAKNVYAGTDEEFLNVNPEDMLLKQPDIIFRTAHAMPEDVMEMFQDEFKENNIWGHFDAVKNDKVYDLPHESFGMSATFNYKEGLEYLKEILYRKK